MRYRLLGRKLLGVFQMIAAEYEERVQPLPLPKSQSARCLARVLQRRSGTFGALTVSPVAKGIGPAATCMTVDNVPFRTGLPGRNFAE